MIANTTFKKAVDEYDRFVSNDDFISKYEKRQVFLYAQRIMLEKEYELGAHDAKIEMAKNLIKIGLPTEQIITVTGLCEEEILLINE